MYDQTLEYFRNRILKDNEKLLSEYNKTYDYLSLIHPIYNRNWRVKFLDNHRFMNWILYSYLMDIKENRAEHLLPNNILSGDITVMDIGCYDSFLVAALNKNGIDAYGYDDNDWADMFGVLGTTHKTNFSPNWNRREKNIDVAIVLNYAHMFKPDDLLSYVEEKCGNMPSAIFFDFDASVQHVHHHLYEASRANYKTLTFPASSERELYIWHA